MFYIIVTYVGNTNNFGLLFKTKDPLDEAGWGNPLLLELNGIDPDLFWDDDGRVFVATAGISLQELDIGSGILGEAISIWNGTSGSWPEGPHIYKKDGWYYLLIAEGGTSEGHSISIARAKYIRGPYESNPSNPILTNRDTEEYFQSVGHGDLFQDVTGSWWGLCLAIRSGPSYDYMPMGREAVLFNATWVQGAWPELQPVRGWMATDGLPSSSRPVSQNGPKVDADDQITFKVGVTLPSHFIHHRVPPLNAFTVTDGGLRIEPSRANLTGDNKHTDMALTGQHGLSFIGRRQTHTVFRFSVDLLFNPHSGGQQAGISVFRSQDEHIDLSIVRMSNKTATGSCSALFFGLSSISPSTSMEEQLFPVPQGWENGPIRLHVEASNASNYIFSVSRMGKTQEAITLGNVSSGVVSGRGGVGFFLGSLVGVFATCNGKGTGNKCTPGGEAYVKSWAYEGIAQEVDVDEVIPVNKFARHKL
ncbi:unnamed protein product [Clonostachys chloroleuca]|uniref:Beta-xylosidase C-terminal Concanavalin A-like domain-containing protein n=1 Tax=Clonostachys chloroleuca TaxID=1926264 RepID=A0AA35M880_9HYPO|nr:unnamed protein product [Clonostachys chloroleuca]